MTQHAMLVIWGDLPVVSAWLGYRSGQAAAKKAQPHTTNQSSGIPGRHPGRIAAFTRYQPLGTPLDQDPVVAAAWGQDAWADYSGVSRTLSRLTPQEVTDLAVALDSISQPFIDREVDLALAQAGEIVYDADLTGRPISSTSSSYPNTAFGHMGDAIELGYQAALVSMHSPTYGRLWLANELHPGDTVSMTRTQALVIAAEKRTGRRPRRRTELLAGRLAAAQTRWETIADQVEESYQRHREAQDKLHDARLLLREWEQEVHSLTVIYERKSGDRQLTAN